MCVCVCVCVCVSVSVCVCGNPWIKCNKKKEIMLENEYLSTEYTLIDIFTNVIQYICICI